MTSARLPLIAASRCVAAVTAVGILTAAASGCAPKAEPEYPRAEYSSEAALSSSSSKSSGQFAPSSSTGGAQTVGFPAAGAPADRAGIVVRPDVLSIPFTVRAVAADAKAGTAVLEEAVRKLEPRFVELAPKRAAMQLRMRGIEVETRVTATTKAKSDEKDKKPTVCVILHGVVVYTLDSAQTYWDRSHQIAKVADVSEEVGRLSRAEGSAYVATFGKPELHVNDPEARRGELTARWAARRKDFAREAKSADLAVALDGCRAPSEIVERVLSLEEIELSLPVECRPAVPK